MKKIKMLRNSWILLLMISLLSVQLSAQSTDSKTVNEKDFKHPPNEYRITQYQLTPQTLKQYPEYGIGGTMAFFYSILYPESGRENYMLGEKGAQIIGELVEAAQAMDYKVWLADDWGYPSGMAGGRVVAENPDWEVKGLTMLTLDGQGQEPLSYALPEDLHDIVYAFIYPLKEGVPDLSAGQAVSTGKKEIRFNGRKGDWQLKIFARYVRDKFVQAQSTMEQFGHTGRYPDLMNKDAMASFIAHMHEPTLAQIKEPASRVEGFYTNEPNLMQTHWKWDDDAPYACVPWSEALPAQFQKMHDYDISSILPYLFEGDEDAARRARIHYRQAVTELLTNSFARQIREWCNARGIKSSGHFLLNDYLSMHVQGYGDLMKFVSEFDVPALDIPIPNPDEFLDFAYQQTRFFSSVTSWKKRDMTIMLLDPIIGGYGRSRLSPRLPLLLNSVNMASFHGANLFTSYLPLEARAGKVINGYKENATGYTKEEFIFFNEYTGRLTQVLRGANREAGVGLYYPIAMFQSDLLASGKFWPKILQLHEERQQKWDQTEQALLDGDIEYMIVHPEAVAEATVEKGHMQIGDGSYHTLVMPQIDFIPLAVVEQIKRFEKGGGKVLWVDQLPNRAEYARHDRKVKKALRKARKISAPQLGSLIKDSFSPEFDLRFSPGTDQLTIGRFHKNGEQVYLLVNRLQEPISVEVQGRRGGAGKLRVLDPSTGVIEAVDLPAQLPLQANRSLLLLPEKAYLEQKLIKE